MKNYNIEDLKKAAGIQLRGIYKRIRKLKIKPAIAGRYTSEEFEKIINFDTKRTGKRKRDVNGNKISKWDANGNRNIL